MEREDSSVDFQKSAVIEVSEAVLRVMCGSPVTALGDAFRADPSLNERKKQV